MNFLIFFKYSQNSLEENIEKNKSRNRIVFEIDRKYPTLFIGNGSNGNNIFAII